MRQYDILFLDLDDTLLAPDHITVSQRNRAALQAAKNRGVRLAVSSGRCLKLIPSQIWNCDFSYAITSNGGAIYDLPSKRAIGGFSMSPSLAILAWELLRPEEEMIEWFVNGGILLDRESAFRAAGHEMPPWHCSWLNNDPEMMAQAFDAFHFAGLPGLEKINLTHWNCEAVSRARAALEATGLFALSNSVGRGRSLEINMAGCSKGAAIRWLCENTGISLSRTAAFGDGDNDIEMLQTVGCGVAMGNASKDARRAADAVTLPSDQDGVAVWIEREILSREESCPPAQNAK